MSLDWGCSHERYTWPLTVKLPEHRTYVVCLECGKEFDYSWKLMRIVKAEKQEMATEFEPAESGGRFSR